MSTYFVTRHQGAVEWAKSNGFDVNKTVPHVDDDFIDNLVAGDVVIGILPYPLAAQVCAKKARFYNLSIPSIPPEYRGKDLTASQMTEFNATVQQYEVKMI